MDWLEVVKWISGLNPGEISAYAQLIITAILIGGLLNRRKLVLGSEHELVLQQLKEAKEENATLTAALKEAKDGEDKQAELYTEARIELVALRKDREYGWQQHSQRSAQ